ncbi:MAG: gliding motility ABC transporter [Spirochaetia bacterium]|nr:gliding motility ABC transporter [Spirochaetia bacterium]
MSLSWSNIRTIYNREINNYFNTPIGYVFLIIFSLFINFLFLYLPNFWDVNSASMENFFSWMRIVYMFLIPAITMRLWAEEKKTGTIEVIFTMPYQTAETILGKYLSALSFLGFALCSTIFIPISIGTISSPDWMLIIGGYLGLTLLGAAYIAMGLFISWFTQDQIIAFLITIAACFLFFIMGYPSFLQLMGILGPLMAYASVSWHYDSLARGMFDTRDIFYFLTFIGIFMYMNYFAIENKK